jgi:hypothetical protein
MAQYYFHSEDGHPHEDEQGLELADLTTARREALRMLGDLIRGKPEYVLDTGHFKIVVTDEQRAHLFDVRLSLVETSESGA